LQVGLQLTNIAMRCNPWYKLILRCVVLQVSPYQTIVTGPMLGVRARFRVSLSVSVRVRDCCWSRWRRFRRRWGRRGRNTPLTG